jgi:hypothetical protein
MDNSEYHAKYYQEHKQHILESMKKRVHCDVCNKDIYKCNQQRHINTKVHLDMEKKQKKMKKDKVKMLESRIKELEDLLRAK